MSLIEIHNELGKYNCKAIFGSKDNLSTWLITTNELCNGMSPLEAGQLYGRMDLFTKALKDRVKPKYKEL